MEGRQPRSILYKQFKTTTDVSNMVGNFASGDGSFLIAPSDTEIYDVESIILEMTLAASVDVTKFGDITALSTGVTVKVLENTAEIMSFTPVTWKTNNDFEKKFQLTNQLSDKSMFGEWLLRTPIRLDGSKKEQLQVLFTENLTSVAVFFEMIATGNIVKYQ